MIRPIAMFAGWLLCGAAVAGPVQLERISSDATWLIHADLDAMRSNAAGQEFLRIGADAVEEVAQAIRQELGIDLISQVRSITIYGPALGKRKGVTLIDVDPSADLSRFIEGEAREASREEVPRTALPEASEADQEVQTTDGQLRVIVDAHSQKWFIARKSRDARDVFVVGDDQNTVLQATQVLEGARASMRTSVVLGLLGPSVSEVPNEQPLPFVHAVQWPFDKLPARISDRVMMTIAIAEMPPPPLEGRKGSAPLPAIAQTRGVLATLGEIRDETQTPWVEAEIFLRMQTDDAATGMHKLVTGLLQQLSAAMPGADGQAAAQGIEVSCTGTDVHVRAKEKLEKAVAGLSGGQADGAVAIVRLLRQSRTETTPVSDKPQKSE